jgi:hypothetical protein
MTSPQTRAPRKVKFTQADLSRAIKAATEAGLSISQTRILPSGEIVLEHQKSEVPRESRESMFDAWRARAGKP